MLPHQTTSFASLEDAEEITQTGDGQGETMRMWCGWKEILEGLWVRHQGIVQRVHRGVSELSQEYLQLTGLHPDLDARYHEYGEIHTVASKSSALRVEFQNPQCLHLKLADHGPVSGPKYLWKVVNHGAPQLI